MRIESVYLHSFGHFLDREFPFANDAFVLVYGQNESGKSTLLRAIREGLFGFTRSAFALQGDCHVSIRGILGDGRHFAFSRKRATKKSLFEQASLDGASSLEESQWSNLTNQMKIDSYTNLFGFGLAELAAGELSLKQANLTEAILGGGQAKSIDWKKIRNQSTKTKASY